MSPKKIGLVVAALAVLGAGAVGGASLAGAAANGSSGTAYGEGSHGSGQGGRGPGGPDGAGGPGGPGGPGGGSQDSAVTGSEATRVEAAVKAKYAAVAVRVVRKDPDGSYDVLGTRNGSPVMYDVSKDLKTFTEHIGGPGAGPDQGQGAAPAPGSFES